MGEGRLGVPARRALMLRHNKTSHGHWLKDAEGQGPQSSSKVVLGYACNWDCKLPCKNRRPDLFHHHRHLAGQ
jgi:hypothetical protein